jgi:Cobalamin biosynthesis protein CbiD
VLRGERVSAVVVPTPIGLRIEIPVERTWLSEGFSCSSVRKFSGDNPDVLDGAEIVACVKASHETSVIGGKGVGKVEGSWVRGTNGYAISEGAHRLILMALEEVGGNYTVIVEVPGGEELASKTMNPSVGVTGGISILGTTGVEWPVSDEEYTEHVKAEICQEIATFGKVVIAPGNVSYEWARRAYGHAVKVGDRVGDALEIARERNASSLTLVSLPGKLTKLAAGMLNTHSKYGDCRVDVLTRISVLLNIPLEKVAKVASSRSVAESLYHLDRDEVRSVMLEVCRRVLKVVKTVFPGKVKVVALNEAGTEVIAEVED